ncbi:MAG: hypothetical protein KBT46_04950 [Ruminococcus sp.]|nr:hypothetical protein [Candidatus Copronaster equi]
MMKKLAVINEFSIEAIKDALQKLDDFDSFVLNGLNAYQLNEIEKIDPSLFLEISEKIKAGKWNPNVGIFGESNEVVSRENLTRNILYSSKYFKEKFNKEYRVFFGEKIYNSDFAQIVYKGYFDAAVISSEKESFWLDGADTSRTLVIGGNIVDVNDIDDDFIKENEFATYEQLAEEIFNSPNNMKSITAEYEKETENELESKIVFAEKVAAFNGEDVQNEIEECWKLLFDGKFDEAEKNADEIIGGRTFDDKFIKIDSDDIELVNFKFCEDGSGDKFFRIRETAGKEHTLQIVCNELELGIRCEIIPYEFQNFRVDKDGFVKETFIQE